MPGFLSSFQQMHKTFKNSVIIQTKLWQDYNTVLSVVPQCRLLSDGIDIFKYPLVALFLE